MGNGNNPMYWCYTWIFINFKRCCARGQPSAGPLIPIDFHQKNTIDLKKGSLKWVKPPGTISKYCKTMFWSGLKPFRCILCSPEVILLEILGFLTFLGSRSRRGPEPPRDENFEDSERIFKILEGNSSDFHEFSLKFEEFRDLRRFSVRRQARSLWISLKFFEIPLKFYWILLIFLDIHWI